MALRLALPAPRPPPRAATRPPRASASDSLSGAATEKPHHQHKKKKKKPAYPSTSSSSLPDPYLPPHKLSLSPEERAAPPPTVLARAGEEVAAYCARLPAGSPEAAECEDALAYLRATTSAAGAACGVDPTVGGPRAREGAAGAGGGDCADLDRFDAFVREMLYSGGVASFVEALARRRAIDARAAAGGLATAAGRPLSSAGAGQQGPPPSPPSPDVARRRAALVALFHAYDRSHRGRLDAAQFRAAAADAAGGRQLDAQAVATIFETLDVHGAGVSLDDFLAAVEADELASHTPLATWLRRHPAGEDGGAGWQHLPGSLDMLL